MPDRQYAVLTIHDSLVVFTNSPRTLRQQQVITGDGVVNVFANLIADPARQIRVDPGETRAGSMSAERLQNILSERGVYCEPGGL